MPTLQVVFGDCAPTPEIKTTSTAEYAAPAAKISVILAPLAIEITITKQVAAAITMMNRYRMC
jgi:hypothetical protein